MNATKHKIYGLILAGGYSRRMGRDKAVLEFHGKPQAGYLFDLLSKFCTHVYVSKRPDQQLGNIHDCPYAFVDDASEFAAQGPLGGILSAMKKYPGVSWLVVACDLPFVVEVTLQTLINLRDPLKNATAFISSKDGLPEPLCAIWEGKGFSAFLKLFEEGVKCPRKILLNCDVHLIEQNYPQWMQNINTPEEFKQVKAEFE